MFWVLGYSGKQTRQVPYPRVLSSLEQNRQEQINTYHKVPHIFSVEKLFPAYHPLKHTTTGLSLEPQDADPYLCCSCHSHHGPLLRRPMKVKVQVCKNFTHQWKKIRGRDMEFYFQGLLQVCQLLLFP